MQRFIGWADSHREYWLDCVRIYLGVGLFVRGLLLITNHATGFYEEVIFFFHERHQVDVIIEAGAAISAKSRRASVYPCP